MKYTIKNYLDIIQILALIIGLGFAGYQLEIQNQALQANREQLQIQSNALKDSSRIASADFILQLSIIQYDPHYDKVSRAVNDNSSNYSLKLHGIDNNLIDDYIGNFDTLGYLVRDGVVNQGMAYDEFSYVIEKAWCNKDIKKYVDDSRKEDNIYAGPDAFYSSNPE